MEARTDEYLLDRETAARRYGTTIRGLEGIYRSNPDFPIIRIGRKVMIHKRYADEWFDQFVGDRIDLEE